METDSQESGSHPPNSKGAPGAKDELTVIMIGGRYGEQSGSAIFGVREQVKKWKQKTPTVKNVTQKENGRWT